MPHLTIEYSSNLDGDVDVQQLCDVVLAAMMASGLFELGATRVRAIRCEAYAIADSLPKNAFIDMNLRIGAGRSADDRERAGAEIFKAVAEYLAPFLSNPYFALSLEIREIDPVLSWKQNTMHARVRSATR